MNGISRTALVASVAAGLFIGLALPAFMVQRYSVNVVAEVILALVAVVVVLLLIIQALQRR